MDNNQRKQLTDVCKRLLSEEKVGLILAYTDGDLENSAIPFFVRKPDEIDKLKWDDYCNPNLAKYLLEKQGKVGIVAKPCDARAIVMYIVENQVARDNIYIIGMECKGMKKHDGSLSPGCDECTVHIPPLFDILIKSNGEVAEQKYNAKPDSEIVPYTGAAEDNGAYGEAESGDIQKEKLEKFRNELKKCILCFSCRQACYGCYCPVCFIERSMPNWLPTDLETGAKMVFHLGRAMHLAGRCVECGACEKACPSGVKIRYLIKEITDFCRNVYGYRAGMDPGETPALAAFNKDDREIGFLGGEKGEMCCNTKK
ncbi:MAG: hypothetical protein HPY74_03820 [Firmicutes bacterium]|nr:hypothetical protein [Bacillota bacterium]